MVNMAEPVMLPVALTKPAVKILPPCTLPATVTKLAVLSNVNPAEAPNISPVSLNCTCVLEPAASTLPVMLPMILPIKYGAVTLPVDEILPLLMILPDVTVPDTLKLVNTPTEVILACALPVTVAAVLAVAAEPAVVANAALATVPVTLAPVMLLSWLPSPVK